MEERSIQEALELVRHAMSLVDLKLYDDAIRILRQATRLYEQTNLEAETNALRRKIAEIYTLKENALSEDKAKPDLEQASSESISTLNNIEMEVHKEEKAQEFYEQKLSTNPEQLVKEGEKLVKLNRFEEALDKYDEAIKMLNISNRSSEVDNIYKLIEECYVTKGKFLRKSEEEQIVEETKVESEKLNQFGDSFEEKKIITEPEKSDIEIEKLKVVEDKYKRDFEDEDLQKKVTSMVNEAERMVREYESKKLRSLKNGHFEEPCIYPDVIVIYNEIYNLLLERGWVDQAKIYTNQISIYKEKLEQDIKLRELEAMKAQKEKDFEVLMKSDKATRTMEIGTERLKSAEEKLKREFEDEKFQNFITESVDTAEKMVRDYELEIKKGNFEVEPPYQRVIDIYTDIRQNLIERQWLDQVDIYTNQIRIYTSKLEQDKKLRGVEAQKREKDKAYLESLKVQKEEPINEEKKIAMEEKYKDELQETKFQNLITSLAEEADKIERDYETKKKRAIKEKNLLEIETPYPKILEIYEKIRDMLLQKGWSDQARVYLSQIQVYTEKFERDKILREIEAHKLQR